MRTYILLTLALMSFATATLSQHKPFFLATVLFYNDGKGHQIAAAGHIPKKVYKAIRKDIVVRLGNTTAKVVAIPLFFHASTPTSEIRAFVKHTYLNVYSVEIPNWLATEIVNRKSKKMALRNIKNDDLAHDTHNEEALNTNLISEGKLDEKSVNVTQVPHPFYLPNTVFYAVETKCITPTDYSCYFNHRHHHNNNASHHRTFKTMFMKTASKDLMQ